MGSDRIPPERSRRSIGAAIGRFARRALLAGAIVLLVAGAVGQVARVTLASVYPRVPRPPPDIRNYVYIVLTGEGFECFCMRASRAAYRRPPTGGGSWLNGRVQWYYFSDRTVGWDIWFAVSWWMPSALCVAYPALFYARRAAAAWRRARRRKRGLCAHCGYNLTGNVSGRCSECGTPIPGAGPHAG